MNRLDILNDTDYMFETEYSSSEVMESVYNLINEFIDNYGISDECSAEWVDCAESDFWIGAPSDYILVYFEDGIQDLEDKSEILPNYLIFDDGYNMCVLNLKDTFGSFESWMEFTHNNYADEEVFQISKLNPYMQKESIQDPDACASKIAEIFSNEYGEDISLQDIEHEIVEEGVKIDTIDSKLTTNNFTRSKTVGELLDDPDEEEDEKRFKRRLKKLGYNPAEQGGQQEQGGGMGMFGESYIFKGKGLRIFEYEYAKKEAQPMDYVDFQGQEAQVTAVNPDGTYTLLCQGMTIDGVTKRQIKLVSYKDLVTPLQFGKFNKFGNPEFDQDPWDNKSSKFHDLNTTKVTVLTNAGVPYNEAYAAFKDIVSGNEFVRVLNEDMKSFELTPRENVKIVNTDNLEEWPYAVIVIDQSDEEPQRKIKVNPVSYCNAQSDDKDVEVLMNPSSNTKPTMLKKKFIRILT